MSGTGGARGLRALPELVRAPAALTVPGDSLAGAVTARQPLGWHSVGLAGSSICLYWAGMALNDWADRHLDAVERPERPLPSGRVSAPAALAVASGLTAGGLALAGLSGGRRSLGVSLLLAGTVWAYDLRLKRGAAGPAAMACARGLDVLLGAGGEVRRALPAALPVAAHTLATTALSRAEVHGARPLLPVTAAGGMAVALAGALVPQGPSAGQQWRWAPGATYALAVGPAQAAAVRDPGPVTVRRAVGAAILGLLPLQGTLLARAGAPLAGAAVTATLPLARALTRRVAAT